MCEQCLTSPIYFGEPIPGFVLARARQQGNDWNIGEWGLIECNDPAITWTITPTPSPVWGMTDEEEDAWFEATDENSPEYKRAMAFPYAFSKHFEDCGPNLGYWLIKAAIEKGYNPDKDGQFTSWFFDYLGEYLVTAIEDIDEDDPFPNREADFPIDRSIGRNPIPGEPALDDD